MWMLFGAIVGGVVGNLFENGAPSLTKKLQPIGLSTVVGAAIGAFVIPGVEMTSTSTKISGLPQPPRQVLP